jgi:hypothetical protein
MFQTNVVEKIKIHILCSLILKNLAVCEIVLKNTVERGRQLMTIRRMRIASWISKITNTHSQYVILFTIPLQQWLHVRSPVLRYTYITCLVKIQFSNLHAVHYRPIPQVLSSIALNQQKFCMCFLSLVHVLVLHGQPILFPSFYLRNDIYWERTFHDTFHCIFSSCNPLKYCCQRPLLGPRWRITVFLISFFHRCVN